VVLGEKELSRDGEVRGQGSDARLELWQDRLEEDLARPHVVLVAREHYQLLQATHVVVG
jgi:hypothetical protein